MKEFVVTNIRTNVLLVVLIGMAVSCSEAQPAVTLEGGMTFEGERNEDGELECEVPTDPTEVERFVKELEIDIQSFENVGQPGVGNPGDFELYAGLVNELDDSTQVGGQEGAGASELRKDSNRINLQELTVKFPSSENNFTGAGQFEKLNKTRPLSVSAESGGGGVIFSIPIIRESEAADLREAHKRAAQAAGIQNNPEAHIFPLTVVVRAKGETVSGRTIKTNKIKFPIRVCRNCSELRPTSTCYEE